jgi:hypothetical protein
LHAYSILSCSADNSTSSAHCPTLDRNKTETFPLDRAAEHTHMLQKCCRIAVDSSQHTEFPFGFCFVSLVCTRPYEGLSGWIRTDLYPSGGVYLFVVIHVHERDGVSYNEFDSHVKSCKLLYNKIQEISTRWCEPTFH